MKGGEVIFQGGYDIKKGLTKINSQVLQFHCNKIA